MNVTVAGAGYVGLVTAACLAEMGNQVVCVDTNQGKIDNLKRGVIPIIEPGLSLLVEQNVAAQRLEFTTDIAVGVAHGRVIFIAVGTPPDEDGSADLQYVLQIARSVGDCLEDYRVVAIKSTVPVGSAQKVRQCIQTALQQRGCALPFSVVSNPEFLKEGTAVDDFMRPDRIIIGSDGARSLALMQQLYAPFNRNSKRVIVMDIASAELTKYAANAMLATKISFINEMAGLAECLGADIESVRIGIGADPRIGYDFIYPGCGYGGSCFPKDVQALQHMAATEGCSARILQAVETVNQRQQNRPVEKIAAHFGDDLSGRTFALWGLSFKPDTDDMRAAPSRVIMQSLWQMGAVVQAFDPVATPQARRIYADRNDDLRLYHDDPYAALQGADGLIVVTEWRLFRAASAQRIKAAMRGNVVVDGRNIFSPQQMRDAGLVYYGIGRP